MVKVWVPMDILSVTEGVKNPRPEFLKAHEENALSIAHYVDEETKTAICGARFISGFHLHNGQSIGLESLDEDVPYNHWSKRTVVCEKCLEGSKDD